jgi:hypothetical protein
MRHTFVLVLVLCVDARVVSAQASTHRCALLCAPTVTLMPALLRTHLFGGPRVQTIATGATHRLPSTSTFQLIVATAARTAVPRLSAFMSVQWVINASEARNPFTQYSASELGSGVRANAPTVTAGLSAAVLAATQTAGILDVDVNAGDLFSQAARPDDRSAYTHKLDLDLLTHWHVFSPLPPGTWAHRVTLFGILDYVATGLPHAGDEVPKGRRFLDNARPTSLLVGLSLPITPEVK